MANYRLLDKLGEGGMGVVFRAVQEPLGREVAIKFLMPDAIESPERLERFRREVQSCIKLVHPNIVRILDSGETDGKHYYVMELLTDAVPLDKIVKSQAPLEMKLAATLMDQLLDALAYCHSNGFIHRDIKPANVMVRKDGQLILMDFGLVKATDRKTVLTQQGKIYGTPHYLSPELLRAKPASAQSDLFAAGALFYELLTGKLAFPGSNISEIAKAIIKDDPRPISEIRPDLPPTTDALMQGFLAKDVAERFPTAAKARERLTEWLAGRPAGTRTGRLQPVVSRTQPLPVVAHPSAAALSSTLPMGGPARSRLAIGGAAAVAVLAVVGLVLGRLGPVATPAGSIAQATPASAGPGAGAGGIEADLGWGACGVRLTWSSTSKYAARVEARLPGETSSSAVVATTAETSPGLTHHLVLAGLQPTTAYQIEGRDGAAMLFRATGHTRSLSDVGQRLRGALETFGAWDLVMGLRREIRSIPVGAASAMDARKAEIVKRWGARLDNARKDPLLAAALEDFSTARDAYFGSLEVPLEDKRMLYLVVQEVRELEDVARARSVALAPLTPALVSAALGMASGTHLTGAHAVSILWTKDEADQLDKTLVENTVLNVDADDTDRFVTNGETRKRRFEPAPVAQDVSGNEYLLREIGHWNSEPSAKLPLPDPSQVARAEIRADVDNHTDSTFRLWLRAPGERAWTVLAFLRTTADHRQVVWHGLDPRLLVPGAHLRAELQYFEENANPEQAGYLKFVEIRWQPSGQTASSTH